MRWLTTLFFVLVFLLTGCGPREPVPSRTESDLRAAPADPPGVSLATAEVRDAPAEVEVQGAPIRIGAEVWRDYMPISPPEGRPLAAVVWVWAADRASAGPVPEADRAWVVHGDSAWSTVPVKEAPPAESDSFLVRYALRDGPLWGPGVPVDVVLRLQGTDGSPILIRTGTMITRTD
ncbi:MAG TPA: hypothetical protein VFP58_09430 [Candidatus Eisenbacteria bacterium]|nr:hypothetical protein [Candidatus Eisenbacteria bacterium]